jgi:nicotinamidase-related amidase
MATALLILDVTSGTVPQLPFPDKQKQDYLTLLSSTISHARTSNIKIIFVRVSFRHSHPEISSSNSLFSKLLNTNRYLENTPETEIHPDLGYDAEKGDFLVTKKRISAFCGSELEVLLRGLGVRKLVLMGLVTSGTVLGTAFEASDRDFEIVVLRNACLDREEEINRVVMEKVLSKVAKVVDAQTWVEGLS